MIRSRGVEAQAYYRRALKGRAEPVAQPATRTFVAGFSFLEEEMCEERDSV
jgi:hypothetical protein